MTKYVIYASVTVFCPWLLEIVRVHHTKPSTLGWSVVVGLYKLMTLDNQLKIYSAVFVWDNGQSSIYYLLLKNNRTVYIRDAVVVSDFTLSVGGESEQSDT